ATVRDMISDDVIIYAGDIILPKSHIKDVLNAHESLSPFGTLSLFKANIDHVPGLGNVKIQSDGTVTRIIEKPSKDQLLSNYYSLPFYIFNKGIFEYLDACPISPRGEREFQDAIQMAINDGKRIIGVSMKKEFSSNKREFYRELSTLHVTNIKDYFMANMNILSGLGIDKPADILCTMIEPVQVGKNCSIDDDCLLGPKVIIQDNVKVSALTEISNAIVQKDCKIGRNSYISHAIIMQGRVVDDGTEIQGSVDNIKLV
ncbi:MAG: sugar phosphate nucleotidyltransferase, partial [Promethearchaeota archaeon]